MRVTTYPGRQQGRYRKGECSGLSIDSHPSNDQYQRGGWLAICPLYGSAGRSERSRSVAGAVPDCVRRPTTTIYYECHTNTRQRSNFVIESKLPSTHHIADRSRRAPPWPLYSCRSRCLPTRPTDHTSRQSIDVARGPTEPNHDNNRQPVGWPPSEKTILTALNIVRPTDDGRPGHINGAGNARTDTTFGQRR